MQRRRLFRYLRTFWVAGSLTLLTLAAVLWYLGPAAAFIALLLVILEVTFSFENAVINARVLRHMSYIWQQIFMTIGIAIAVFGMRIVFPIVLVAVTAGLSAPEVLHLALNDPDKYTAHLEHAQPTIAAFGGMFLFMVFLNYFILENNDKPWLSSIENALRRLPRRWYSGPLIAAGLLLVVALLSGLFTTVMTAGLVGLSVYLLMHGLMSYMQSRHLAQTTTKLVGWGGFAAFMYLEVLDASFSFDGVIGAFAITSSVVLIAAGLGAGAVWVRSMTVYLVRNETLAKYSHLEQGAHYAIGLLALVLLSSLFIHLPEVVTGLLGVSIIAASIFSSRKRRMAAKNL